MIANNGTRDGRPSPDALLDAAERETRGRLKIFLGAAPGVGKTYEMLQTAQAKRREGVDVVVGVAETHGRRETAQLLRGLEVIPRKRIDYRGLVLEEMDLDAVLARRPRLVLVDELAHTNAEGVRHPKRYLDVEELIAAGIDVYTTLNIQHVESLNDVVAQITRIRVRETVPDSVLDSADDIEVVDLSPGDLIQRLNEGKVYVPKTAKRALDHYFAPGNLTALRELALRQTAQRVDEQLLTHMRAHAIRGPWAAGERVVVCINEQPQTAGLVRHAKRVADRLHAPWTAIHIETLRTHQLSEAARDRIADCQRLAERLGGEALTLPGHDIAEEIVAYAHAHNVTQIIIGKAVRTRWFELLHGSVVRNLLRRSGNIGVHVIAGETATTDTAITPKTLSTETPKRTTNPSAYLGAVAIVAAALGLGLIIEPYLGNDNNDLIFLTAVFVVAVNFGLLPSITASILSMFAYNFFFLPPLYTFAVSNPAHLIAVFFFLAAALFASNLAGRVRDQVSAARMRARTTEALYAFSRKIAGVASLDDLLWAAAFQISSMLNVNVVVLLPEDGSLHVRAGYPPEDLLDDADFGAASWSWNNNKPAGRGAETLPGARRLFLPLRTSRGPVGVVGLDSEQPGSLLTPDERRLLDALLDQTAVAVERVRLAEDFDKRQVLAETERLRAALLNSISHDLSTPLAAILGAATSLQQYEELYDAQTRRDLVGTIRDEAERLRRFVHNLLDMTRLESGALELNREMIDIGEVIGAAIERCSRILEHHRLDMHIEPELPMLELDPVLFEQALVNIFDNAAKYAPAGSTVTIDASCAHDAITVSVLDEGPGIPLAEIDRIFEKFRRLRLGDRQRAGTGLGLAVCRGFIEALGGSIRAANRPDRSGAVFTIIFPRADAAGVPVTGSAV